MERYCSGRSSGTLHLTAQTQKPASAGKNHEAVCPGTSPVERIVTVPGRKTFGRFTVYIDEQNSHSFFSFSRNGKDECLGKYPDTTNQSQPKQNRGKSILDMAITSFSIMVPACVFWMTWNVALTLSISFVSLTYNSLARKRAAKIIDERRLYFQNGIDISSIPHVTFHLDQKATSRLENWLEAKKADKQLAMQDLGDNCSDFVREGFQQLGFNQEYVDYFPKSFLKMSGVSLYIVFRQARSWSHFFKQCIGFWCSRTILPKPRAYKIKRICERILKRNDQFEKLLLADQNLATRIISDNWSALPYQQWGSGYREMLKSCRFHELSEELQESVVSIQEKLRILQKSKSKDQDAEYAQLLESAIKTQHWSERAICKLEDCPWTDHKFSSTSS